LACLTALILSSSLNTTITVVFSDRVCL